MDLYDRAYEIAEKAHKGQKDRAGEDYFQHVIFVANLVDGEQEKAVALLHDVVEDTATTIDDLRAVGIPDEVISAVAVLTKQKSDSYFEYIEQVKKNELARKIKLADLTHNADLNRFSQPSKKDYERRGKYIKAMEILKD